MKRIPLYAVLLFAVTACPAMAGFNPAIMKLHAAAEGSDNYVNPLAAPVGSKIKIKLSFQDPGGDKLPYDMGEICVYKGDELLLEDEDISLKTGADAEDVTGENLWDASKEEAGEYRAEADLWTQEQVDERRQGNRKLLKLRNRNCRNEL